MTKRKFLSNNKINSNNNNFNTIIITKTKTKTNTSIIYKYDIDPYQYTHEFLIDCSIDMFIHYNLLTIYGIEQINFRYFLYKVNELYQSENYFHNFNHAWSVLHSSFQILTHGADKLLDSIDILAVLISSLCHDLKHPGTNNAFELATHSNLSKLYNFVSNVGSRPILEYHHLTQTLNLLNEYDLLMNLNNIQKNNFFREVSIIILGTDMAQHSVIVNELKSYTNHRKTRNSLSSRNNIKVMMISSKRRRKQDVVLNTFHNNNNEYDDVDDDDHDDDDDNTSCVEVSSDECNKSHHDGNTDEESKSYGKYTGTYCQYRLLLLSLLLLL